MRKPRTAALLLAGHILLALSPMAAHAATTPAPAGPTAPAAGTHQPSYDRSSPDDHYRCMYRCAERYGSSDGYQHDRGSRYGYGYGYHHDGYHHDRYHHDGYHHDRVYHDGECYYHDDWGWHRCGYYRSGYHRGY